MKALLSYLRPESKIPETCSYIILTCLQSQNMALINEIGHFLKVCK